MKKTVMLAMSVAMVFLMTINTHASNSIQRVETQFAAPKAVAMALETYGGEFYDISQVRGIRKSKGNVKKLLKKNTLKIKGGERIDISEVKYLFVQGKFKIKPVLEAKLPADEE